MTPMTTMGDHVGQLHLAPYSATTAVMTGTNAKPRVAANASPRAGAGRVLLAHGARREVVAGSHRV